MTQDPAWSLPGSVCPPNSSPDPEVSVLVLNWNGRHWLEACFDALLAQQGPPFTAWLIDNGSTDGSVELIQQQFPTVRILRFPTNLGFAAAYNRAIARIETPLIALLNNDTVVQPGWLAALVEDLAAHPDAVAVSSQVLDLADPQTPLHLGASLTLLGAGFDHGWGSVQAAAHAATLTGAATGAALLLRRTAFQAVGGFDERYFAYFEDVDLCWRFWLWGCTVRYQPRARVLHAYGGSTGNGRLSTFRIYHCQRNRLINMIKHLELRTLLYSLPFSVVYDILRISRFLGHGHTSAATAILIGTYRFLLLLPHLLPERRRIQSIRRRSDACLLRLGVIATMRQAAIEWLRLEYCAQDKRDSAPIGVILAAALQGFSPGLTHRLYRLRRRLHR